MTVLAAQLTRVWVSVYTAGLPSAARRARRDEVESDLWEQTFGPAGDASPLHILARLVFGMPADLSWRLGQARARPDGVDSKKGNQNRRDRMQTLTSRAFIGVALLMTASTLFIGLLVAFGAGQSHVLGQGFPRFIWGIVGVAVAAVTLAGVLIGARSQVLGGAIVLVGTAPLAFLLIWSVVVPILWILLAIFVVARVLSGGANNTAPA